MLASASIRNMDTLPDQNTWRLFNKLEGNLEVGSNSCLIFKPILSLSLQDLSSGNELPMRLCIAAH